jgi:hypothetical protein
VSKSRTYLEAILQLEASLDTSSFCNEDCADSGWQQVELQQMAVPCNMESCRSIGNGTVVKGVKSPATYTCHVL